MSTGRIQVVHVYRISPKTWGAVDESGVGIDLVSATLQPYKDEAFGNSLVKGLAVGYTRDNLGLPDEGSVYNYSRWHPDQESDAPAEAEPLPERREDGTLTAVTDQIAAATMNAEIETELDELDEPVQTKRGVTKKRISTKAYRSARDAKRKAVKKQKASIHRRAKARTRKTKRRK